MTNKEKLQKSVSGIDFASITGYGNVQFNDVEKLHFIYFNTKDLMSISEISKKSIKQLTSEIVTFHAKQLHVVSEYYRTIALIRLKESLGYRITGNWTQNGRVEIYKNGKHTSVTLDKLRGFRF